MAKNLMKPVCLMITFLLHISFFTNLDTVAGNLPLKVSLADEDQKLTHLHFYFHDTMSGPNATVVQVTSPVSNSTTGFGNVYIIDDALTEEPESSSKLLGRAQGMYAYASLNDIGLLMNMNFCFMDGEYNGSTISVMGRNMVLSAVREMAVVGGTGIFRFARGYAQAKTHSIDSRTAIVEYDVFVIHY